MVKNGMLLGQLQYFFFSFFPMSRVYRDCGYVQVLYNRTRTWGRVTVLGRRHLLEYK